MRKIMKNSRDNKKKITNDAITDIILKKWRYLITISILIIVTLPFLSIFNIIDINFIGRINIIMFLEKLLLLLWIILLLIFLLDE